MTPGDHRITAHEVSVKELDKSFGFIDWRHFLKHSINSEKEGGLGSKEKLIMMSPEYFKNVTLLLSSKLKTIEGRKTVENFLVWRVFDSLVPVLTLPFRQARQDMLSTLTDSSKRYVMLSCSEQAGAELG